MKLVSVTLAGENREDKIKRATDSVQDWVDEVVLIDTTNAKKAIRVVQDSCRVPVTVVPLSDRLRQSWCCGEARNEALDAAATVGADWAIEVDTDEEIRLRGEKVRKLLEAAPPDITHFLSWDVGLSYPKDRVFRIPRTGAYQAHNTHEFYLPDNHRAVFPKLRFWEAPKTPEEQIRHTTAVLEGSRKQAEQEPDNHRWHFFVADSLVQLAKRWIEDNFPGDLHPDISHERDKLEEAAAAYEKSVRLNSNSEGKAWALTCAANVAGMLGQYDQGLELCGQAIAHFPGMPETACVASQLSIESQRIQQAMVWCQIAISLGKYKGCGAQIHRLGFTDQSAYWETPYVLMAQAMEQIGRKRDGDALRCTAEIAESRRLEEQR